MRVTHNQVRNRRHFVYQAWDGEMQINVFRDVGAHGFCSAAIVVCRMDDPIETVTRSFYDTTITTDQHPDSNQKMKLRMIEMDTWIAEQLTRLSTGTHFNEGGVGNVTGLLS